MSPIEQPLNCINSPQLQKVRRKQKQHLTPKEKQKEANSVVKVAKNFAPRDQKRHHAHVPKEVLRCANPVESHKDKWLQEHCQEQIIVKHNSKYRWDTKLAQEP